MRNGKIIVITYGTFDLFHVGHVNLLERARAYGDFLIVAVSTDEFNSEKGKKSFFSFEERRKIVQACRYVDLVIPEENWDQKREDIKTHGVDIFLMGNDWVGEFDSLADICEVRYLDRTPGISSTKVKGMSKKLLSHSITEELVSAKDSIDEILRKINDLG